MTKDAGLFHVDWFTTHNWRGWSGAASRNAIMIQGKTSEPLRGNHAVPVVQKKRCRSPPKKSGNSSVTTVKLTFQGEKKPREADHPRSEKE